MRIQRPKGFTLIETVAALAIASIALLALLQLHLVSISTADKAQRMTQAVLLAQEKMAEAVSSGYPHVGVTSGIVKADGDPLAWQMEVTDVHLPPSRRSPSGGSSLRKLSVDVSWQRGPGEKHIRLTTYVAENRIREA